MSEFLGRLTLCALSLIGSVGLQRVSARTVLRVAMTAGDCTDYDRTARSRLRRLALCRLQLVPCALIL